MDIWYEASFGRVDSTFLNEVPMVMYGPIQGLKLLHTDIHWELLKNSSHEPIGLF